MRHLFLDTNVLIDFLADRKPFSDDASKLFNHGLNKKVTLYVASVSFNNIYYILHQSLSHAKTIQVLSQLEELVEIIDVSGDHIRNALRSEFKDFEDAIQYHCAKGVNKIECIVTRNTKDFKKGTIAVMTPGEVASMLYIGK